MGRAASPRERAARAAERRAHRIAVSIARRVDASTCARSRPNGRSCLVLDEMQWADATSWDALEHLVTQLDTDRIMICLTHRPDSTFDSIAASSRCSAVRDRA